MPLLRAIAGDTVIAFLPTTVAVSTLLCPRMWEWRRGEEGRVELDSKQSWAGMVGLLLLASNADQDGNHFATGATARRALLPSGLGPPIMFLGNMVAIWLSH